MPKYKPFTTIETLPTNTNGERTILEQHLDRSHETIADVLERIGQALFTAGGVVIAGTVTNPSAAIVNVVGRMGVSSDCKTFLAVGDQSVDLAAVSTGTKCLVVIRAEAGASASYAFTDPTTGESVTHSLMTSWGRVAVLQGDSSDYPALPDDCVPVAQVTKTGAATLTLDSVITTAPTTRYSGGSSAEVSINAQTGTSYTLVLADAGKLVTFNNGSAITLTIPANSSVAYPVGTVIAVAQLGAGTLTIQGDTGVTVNGSSAGSEALAAQHATASLTKLASDEWLVTGGLS